MTDRKMWRGRRRGWAAAGDVAVEFALVLPLLMILFIGAFGFGFTMYQQTMLTAAVRAGLTYGNVYGNIINCESGSKPCCPASSTSIATCDTYKAVVAAVPYSSPTPHVKLTTFCTCVDGTPEDCPGSGDPNPCTTAYPTDPRLIRYVRIDANEPAWSGVLFPPATLKAATVVRLQ